MGFYCSTQVVNKNNKVICTINTEKYGIGYGIFCFRKEDYTIDIPKRIYVAKTPVPTALERMEKIYHEVIEKRDQKIKEGMKYNAWTQRAINYAIDFMEEVISILKSVAERYKIAFVYADFSEGAGLYEKTEDIDPELNYKNSKEFLEVVLNGCYLGRYPDESLEKKAVNFISEFTKELLKFDGILSISNYGSSFDPVFFRLGNKCMIKFQMDVKFSNEPIEDSYNIVQKVILPIRPFFIEKGCDYEIDYNAEYVKKEGKVRLTVYKLIDVTDELKFGDVIIVDYGNGEKYKGVVYGDKIGYEDGKEDYLRTIKEQESNGICKITKL